MSRFEHSSGLFFVARPGHGRAEQYFLDSSRDRPGLRLISSTDFSIVDSLLDSGLIHR